ncbi:MAG: outer membrane lipoprotein carrier protein LolA [Gemmatimonadetes bacterium]|nr:outer membrane lipoprotein carrier protein LolA [Gemmatimonadota bacterium]
MRARSGGSIALVVAAVVAPTGLPASATAQDRGMALLQQASARYARVATLCADYVQQLLNPLLGQERTARGRLCQARPNLFAMRFTDPAGDVLVVDGASIWYYLPSSDPKQAFRAPVEQGTGGRDFHREFLERPEEKYTVTYEGDESVAGASTYRLRLVPRTRQSYRAAVLWIEQGTSLLRQIRVEEENGNRRTITLSGIQFDVAPPAGFFVFTPPPGVLVGDVSR